MRDWHLLEALRDLRHELDFAGGRCPRCGFHLVLSPVGPPSWWPPHLDSLGMRDVPLKQDVDDLASIGVWTVGQLLDIQPTELARRTQLSVDRLSLYRFLARRYVALRAEHAWFDLLNSSDRASEKITPGLALHISQNDAYTPVEVVIDLRDKLNFEELLGMSPDRRMRTRVEHAERSQRELVSQLELRQSEGDGGYLQVWLSNQIIASLNIQQILNAGRNPSVSSISPALPVRSCMDAVVSRLSASTTMSKRTGKNQIVALLDSGVNGSHKDLASRKIVHKRHYVGIEHR